jgi:acyl dehydratase
VKEAANMSIQSGFTVEFLAFPEISREQLKAYAEASGDFNPIHLDEEVAKKVGLPGIIAHGMLIAALIAERARQFVEKDAQLNGYELAQFQTRFKAMTALGDTPSVGGLVKEVNGSTFTLDLQAKNQRGEVTTSAIVKFRKI